jgi:hypothetical protein
VKFFTLLKVKDLPLLVVLLSGLEHLPESLIFSVEKVVLDLVFIDCRGELL